MRNLDNFDTTDQVGSVLFKNKYKISMNKFLLVFRSRTFWAAVVLFLVAGVDGIKDLIPEALQLPINGLLTLLVGYFRVNPKV